MGSRKEKRLKRLNKKLDNRDKSLETAQPRKGLSGDEVKSNITGNESGFINSAKGYIQGYNGVTIADSGSQVIIAAGVTGGVAESGVFPGMLDRLEQNMGQASGKEAPLKNAPVVGDTGFFTGDSLREAAGRGVEALVPDPQFRKRGPHFDGRKCHAETRKFGLEDFECGEENNCCHCPNGNVLTHQCRQKTGEYRGAQIPGEKRHLH